MIGAGVVGWAPLAHPSDVERTLDVRAGEPALIGIRHLINVEPDPDWINRPVEWGILVQRAVNARNRFSVHTMILSREAHRSCERAVVKFRRATHLIVFGQAHLRRALGKYAACYNMSRIHRSLSKDASSIGARRRYHITTCPRRPSSPILQNHTPPHRGTSRSSRLTQPSVLGGLHHQYVRV